MIVFLIELYLHRTLSKKHLWYSLPFTLLLLSGIGLRVATSPLSTSYILHYLIFFLLLLVLIIDHKLYLLIPKDYVTPTTQMKIKREQISLPSFGSIHSPLSIIEKSRFSYVIHSFSQGCIDLKNILTSKLGIGSPKPSTTVSSDMYPSKSLSIKFDDESTQSKEQFIHPVEKNADKYLTTKQLLNQIGSQTLDHIDVQIDQTRIKESGDIFLPSMPIDSCVHDTRFEENELNEIVQNISDCALIITRGVITAVNDRFSSLIERPKADIVNQNFIHFIAPEGLAEFKSHCMNRLSGDSSQQFPIVLLTKKHKRVHIQAKIQIITINNTSIEVTTFQKQLT